MAAGCSDREKLLCTDDMDPVVSAGIEIDMVGKLVFRGNLRMVDAGYHGI